MATTTLQLTEADKAHIDLNIAKSRELGALAVRLGEPRLAGALGAHLSDLYVEALQVVGLIDAALELTPTDDPEARERGAQLLIDLAGSAEHIAYHGRRAIRPLHRLAVRLDPEDDQADDVPESADAT